MAVEIRKVGADAAQVNEPIDGSKQVILGNMILQRELVEQRRLRLLSWSHHRQYSPRLKELNQQFRPRSRKSFSTKYARECRLKRSPWVFNKGLNVMICTIA
jgi:hypothetical protein